MNPDETEAEAITLATIQRACDDSWPDGKHRYRLKRVMATRLERMRTVTGFQTLAALRAGNPAKYESFLAGCRRAKIRDGLIEIGQLGQTELVKLREAFETRDLHAAFDDRSES